MNIKIMISFVLSCAAAFSAVTSGCSQESTGSDQKLITKESLLENAVLTFTDTGSLDMDVKADLDLSVVARGFDIALNNKCESNIIVHKNGSSHYKGEMIVSAAGTENKLGLEGYHKTDGNDATDYTKLSANGNEGSWIRSVSESEKENSAVSGSGGAYKMGLIRVLNVYDKFKENITDLNLAEDTVSYNGTDCYLVSGRLTGDNLADLVRTVYPDNPYMIEKNDFSKISLDTMLYFRSSDEIPYALELDLRDTVRNIFIPHSGDISVFDISSDKMLMTVLFNEYSKAEEMSVPDDIKNNAQLSVDTFDIQNLLLGV